MIRSLWTWNPVSSGKGRFDEPWAYEHNRWLFDKSVWQRMFRSMYNAGFNALFLANSDPFPFMIDVPEPVLSQEKLARYKAIYHWIFENAREYEIDCYVLFFASSEADYTASCVETLLSDYPEMAGVVVDPDGNNAEFLLENVVRPVEAARADAKVVIRATAGNLAEMQSKVLSHTGRKVLLSAKYTGEQFVHSQPDPEFTLFTERLKSDRVMAEIIPSNFTPFTSFSFETAQAIRENLENMKCAGYSLASLSPAEWPLTSDSHFKFQFQRDLVWLNILGDHTMEDLISEGYPSWLKRQKALLTGFQAASKMLETVSLYFGGNKDNGWLPQLSLVFEDEQLHLFTVRDILMLQSNSAFKARNWWQELIGQPVVHPGDSPEPGAFGPEDFIGYIEELASEADAAVVIASRRAPSEKDLECFMLQAECQSLIGRFWIERLRSALALDAKDESGAAAHMESALSHYRQMADIQAQHAGDFRLIAGDAAQAVSWDSLVSTLESELADAKNGRFGSGKNYVIGNY